MSILPIRPVAGLILCATLAAAWVGVPGAAGAQGTTATGGTGLPLPRFVSLRADEANMRTGPGVQYPVEWVFTREGLPLEVIAEYSTWRKVRDWEGAQGWMHQSMLSNKRMMMVSGSLRTLREKPDTKSPPVARVEPGAIGQLMECPDGSGWCRVGFGNVEGWLRRPEFWGIHRGEVVE